MHKPSFDTWTTIFLFAAIQGLFVSVVLCFVRKENRQNNRLLAFLILLFSVTLIEYVMYWTQYIYRFPHVMNMSSAFPFLSGVILFLYFRNVFENTKMRRSDALHLLPFAIHILYMLPLYLSTAETKVRWMKGETIPGSLFNWPQSISNLHSWFPLLMIAHMTGYAFVIYGRFRGMSRTNNEVRSWFNWLCGLFVLFIASFASYFILVQFPFFNSTWDYMISFSMMFFIYFIAWFGYLQPRVFSGFALMEAGKPVERYKYSALDQEASREILEKLESAMLSQKLYRENDLRLEKLAEAIHVSKHHLSQVINEQKGVSFFEYINGLRIGEAKQLLASTSRKELTVIEVAYSVGFNNKVSFNTTFKKITGKTPTEFRKEVTGTV
jgi:AraC-like DNA-binding protein